MQRKFIVSKKRSMHGGRSPSYWTPKWIDPILNNLKARNGSWYTKCIHIPVVFFCIFVYDRLCRYSMWYIYIYTDGCRSSCRYTFLTGIFHDSEMKEMFVKEHFQYLYFVQSNMCVLRHSMFQREKLNKASQHSKDTVGQLCQHGTCCFQHNCSWVPIIFVTTIGQLLEWCFDCFWKRVELLCGHGLESTKFGFLLASGSFCHGENRLSSGRFDYVAVRIVACEPATNRGGVTSQHGQCIKMARNAWSAITWDTESVWLVCEARTWKIVESHDLLSMTEAFWWSWRPRKPRGTDTKESKLQATDWAVKFKNISCHMSSLRAISGDRAQFLV